MEFKLNKMIKTLQALSNLSEFLGASSEWRTTWSNFGSSCESYENSAGRYWCNTTTAASSTSKWHTDTGMEPMTHAFKHVILKGKGVPWQAQCGPEVSRKFRRPDFITFGTWRWWGRHPHAPAAFTPRICSWYSFSLGAELTPGPRYGWKEYVTEKSSDITGNRSRDSPTSSAAP
jgi:hypothetical protein